MRLEFFTGMAMTVLGLVLASFALLAVGTFFVLLVVADAVCNWVKREVRLWRSVVRHDFDHVGLERVDDRRPA